MNNEKELTESIQNKVKIINKSIETIHNELFEIKSFVKLLTNLTTNHVNDISTEINDEFKNEFDKIIKKMSNSIEIIDDKLFLAEINGIKKIKKTNSGNYIELKNYCSPINSPLTVQYENNDDISSLINFKNNVINEQIICKPEINNYSLLDDFDMNLLNTIDFDVNIFDNKKVICEIIFRIFENNLDFEKIEIEPDKLKKLICKISKHYHNNPYHNFKHACQVIQFTHILLNKIDCKKYFNDYEIFGILMAALIHDIDHPGNTNSFEINIHSNLALKYNDKSVLENHHCSLAFYLIHSKEINLFENLQEKNFSTIRNIIIESVLSTDMKYHSDIISDMKNKFCDSCKWTTYSEKISLSKVIVHLADISNQLRPFDISIKASKALKEEFANQIKNEEKYNLPISEFMKITSDKSFYSGEYYFTTQIVKPSWDVFIKLFPETNEYYQNLITNIDKWKELMDNT